MSIQTVKTVIPTEAGIGKVEDVGVEERWQRQGIPGFRIESGMTETIEIPKNYRNALKGRQRPINNNALMRYIMQHLCIQRPYFSNMGTGSVASARLRWRRFGAADWRSNYSDIPRTAVMACVWAIRACSRRSRCLGDHGVSACVSGNFIGGGGHADTWSVGMGSVGK